MENIDRDYSDDSMTFPMGDKLNWAIVVQRKLSQCVDHKGQPDYGNYVLEALDLVNTDFYGINLKAPISKFFKKLNAAYDKMTIGFLNAYFIEHPRDYPIKSLNDISWLDQQRHDFEEKRSRWYFESIFDCIRDLFAENRGMFTGNDDVRFSRQLEKD